MDGSIGGTRAGKARLRHIGRVDIEDAKKRLPRRKADEISEKAIGDFLREQGCGSRRTNQARGWKFPRLAEMRTRWGQRYPGTVWDHPDLIDWQ
jgi:hypothetical protein